MILRKIVSTEIAIDMRSLFSSKFNNIADTTLIWCI